LILVADMRQGLTPALQLQYLLYMDILADKDVNVKYYGLF